MCVLGLPAGYRSAPRPEFPPQYIVEEDEVNPWLFRPCLHLQGTEPAVRVAIAELPQKVQLVRRVWITAREIGA